MNGSENTPLLLGVSVVTPGAGPARAGVTTLPITSVRLKLHAHVVALAVPAPRYPTLHCADRKCVPRNAKSIRTTFAPGRLYHVGTVQLALETGTKVTVGQALRSVARNLEVDAAIDAAQPYCFPPI